MFEELDDVDLEDCKVFEEFLYFNVLINEIMWLYFVVFIGGYWDIFLEGMMIVGWYVFGNMMVVVLWYLIFWCELIRYMIVIWGCYCLYEL